MGSLPSGIFQARRMWVDVSLEHVARPGTFGQSASLANGAGEAARGTTMSRRVYLFGGAEADGDASMADLLGGKGAYLAEMSRLGMGVPPGFTITTEVGAEYLATGALAPSLRADVLEGIGRIEATLGRKFGDPVRPLLVSVRSGARASMPGILDTVLNLGMTESIASALVGKTGSPRFALDTYRRFVTMYARAVFGLGREQLESKACAGDDMAAVSAYKDLVARQTGRVVPEDPYEQLWGAIGAVFASWNSNRARSFRRLHGLSNCPGTACSVQAMVFGNLDDDSGTGVMSTRDPRTGENAPVGRWLPNAQGDDVLTDPRAATLAELETRRPELYLRLVEIKRRLERHACDALDIEFTVESGRVFLLQGGVQRRTPRAAIRMAVEMAHEGLQTKEQAVLRVEPTSIEALLHPTLDPDAQTKLLAEGLPASPGAASGVVVFAADEAVRKAEAGQSVIFVRVETSPDDVHGMRAASGILTTRGGMASHAALVARGMGKCCVAGCSGITVDYRRQKLTAAVLDSCGRTVDKIEVRAGDTITLDGGSGKAYLGAVPTVDLVLGGDFGELMSWADAFRKLRVRANADIPRDAKTAHGFGAEGIGLCRTEHMFFEKERLPWMVEMIMAKDKPAREAALAKLLPFQREDFVELLREMAGLPVTIRLLDPPLHEFLPHGRAEVEALARHLGVVPEDVERRTDELDEHNPMLGHRGCRLAITYPEIYEMQVRAILLAAIQVKREGIEVRPEIMVPLVAIKAELERVKELVRTIADDVFATEGTKVAYRYGTMIELPRAVLIAGELASLADFFSFGTNDLTQTALGVSRDDAARFLIPYVEQNVLPVDPFQSVDVAGVGRLVEMGVAKGRAANPAIQMGVCGEHGGDPDSIDFFHAIGVDYVSCSPFRVPTARLAAAQAALRSPKNSSGFPQG
jgi:pyruvate,orthophosphate dikinase